MSEEYYNVSESAYKKAGLRPTLGEGGAASI